MMGVRTAEVQLIKNAQGKLGTISKFEDGLTSGTAAQLRAAEGAREGFVIDAWLANWDAVGTGFDNMLLKGGKAFRVDTGGALIFRAQGAAKGGAFGNTVGELASMVNPNVARQAAQVFSGLTRTELRQNAKRLVEISPDTLRQAVKRWGPGTLHEREILADKLISRRKNILETFGLDDPFDG